MKRLLIALLIASVIALLWGFPLFFDAMWDTGILPPSLFQATLALGLMALTCYFATLARMVQAEMHQRETRRALSALKPAATMSPHTDSRAAPRSQTLGQPRQ